MPTISMPWVTFEDIQAAYEGTIAASSEARVQWLIDYACARLARLRPKLEDDLAAGTVDEVLVRATLTNAVLRVLRAPGAFRSESAGEYSYTLNTSVASGLLAFTADELADCSPAQAVSARPRGVGSVTLALPAYRMPG